MGSKSKNVTDEEYAIFGDAYRYFARFGDPPTHQESSSDEWWHTAALGMAKLSSKWDSHPLMNSMLEGVLKYLEHKSRVKTKELSGFVPER